MSTGGFQSPIITSSSQTAAPSGNWWSRNWKWFVPVGCVTMVLLCVLFVAGIVGVVFASLRNSEIVRQSIAQAERNPEVALTLGTPLKPGLLVSGNISLSGSSGNADVSIPVSGPRGKGTIYCVARKSAGQWQYDKLEIELPNHAERVALAGPGANPIQ